MRNETFSTLLVKISEIGTGPFRVSGEIIVTASVNALKFLPAERIVVLNVKSFLCVENQPFVFRETHIFIPDPDFTERLESVPLEPLEFLHFFSGSSEILHFHFLKLASPEKELPRR